MKAQLDLWKAPEESPHESVPTCPFRLGDCVTPKRFTVVGFVVAIEDEHFVRVGARPGAHFGLRCAVDELQLFEGEIHDL